MVVLIELGEPRGPAEEPADGPALTRGQVRAAALIAVALAGLLAFGGAAPVAPPPLTLAAHVGPPVSAPVALAGDLMLAVERREDGRDLVAFEVQDGAERWRTPLTGTSTEVYGAYDAGDTVLVTVMDGAAAAEPWTTYAVDARAGTTLWRERALMIGAVPRGESWTVLLAAVVDPVNRYAGHDVRTGRELWGVTPDGPESWYPYRAGPELRGLVLVESGRRWARLVTPDGVAGARRALPPDTVTVQVAGDLVIVAYERDGARRLAALRLPALDPAWDVAQPVAGLAFSISDCEPLLCAEVGDRVWLLDPGTGAARWQGRVGISYPVAPGLLLSDVNERPRAVVLRDTATGATLLRLAGWSVLAYDGRHVLLTYLGDDRTWFGALDPARPDRVRLLGVGGPALDRCWLGPGTVVCPALLGGLDVYRYRW